MKKRVQVYWLIPSRPESELFRNVIRILTKQFDAALFEPHLTLGTAGGRSSHRRALRQIRGGPIRLKVGGIGHSSKFTKTLFVRFASNQALGQLMGSLAADSKNLRDPHLSLLYKKLTPSIRRELAAAIKLPFREVTFDRIKLMTCVSPTETRRDVESWRPVASKRLSG